MYTFSQALEKLRVYCAYQERAQSEVRQKAYKIGLREDEIEQAICFLIEENCLNEERFARAYARGKFRIKQWGRKKIIQGLKTKQISISCIRLGLKEIDDDEYKEVATRLFEKKGLEYALRRGFEFNELPANS